MNKTFVKNALGPSSKIAITNIGKDIRKKQKILAEKRQDLARFFKQMEAKEKEEQDLKRRLQLEQEKKRPA